MNENDKVEIERLGGKKRGGGVVEKGVERGDGEGGGKGSGGEE